MVEIFEWAGTALGLIGAALLAVNCRYSRLGWVCFLASNVCLLGMAFLIDRQGLQVLQLGFMCTSLLGIWRAGLLGRSGWRFSELGVPVQEGSFLRPAKRSSENYGPHVRFDAVELAGGKVLWAGRVWKCPPQEVRVRK